MVFRMITGFLSDASYGGIFLFLAFLFISLGILGLLLSVLDRGVKTEDSHSMEWEQDFDEGEEEESEEEEWE